MTLRRALGRIALALGASFAALLAAEIVVRIGGWAPAPHTESRGATTHPSTDPILKFEPMPGSLRVLTYRDREGGPPREAIAHVNDLGFRGATVAEAKRERAVRICCFGDSYTFGYGVGDDETWPAQLERALRARFPMRYVEVLNLGVDNYDTMQEVRWIEKQAARFHPDAILLAFFFNDAAPHDQAGGFDLGPPPRLLALLHPQADNAIASLRRVSRLADLACQKLYLSTYDRHFRESRGALYREGSPGWKLAQSQLLRGAQLARGMGAEFIVVLYPLLQRPNDAATGPLATHDPYRVVADFLHANHVDSIDLEPAFEGVATSALRVHPWDSHPNAKAHALAAAAIADGLAKRPLHRKLGREAAQGK